MNLIAKCNGIKDMCRKLTSRVLPESATAVEARRYTASCGLYCKDCIAARSDLYAAARTLATHLDEARFEDYARSKANSRAIFDDYNLFRKMIAEIQALECRTPCSEGGCRPGCGVRDCVRESGLEGCWECGASRDCELLAPLRKTHGQTIQGNLEAIQRYGLEEWTAHRGPHYSWLAPPAEVSGAQGIDGNGSGRA